MSFIINALFLIIGLSVVFLSYRKAFVMTKHIRDKFFYIILFLIHYSLFLKNYYFSLEIKKDSYLFYMNALKSESILEFEFLGSDFMSILIFPFVKIGLSFFTISFIFASISLLAFIKYSRYLLIKINLINTNLLWVVLILFLTPSLHFWTSGLTKEAIIFFLMCVIFFETEKHKPFIFNILISFALILLIRPYLFVILFLCYFLHIFINQIKKNIRVLFLIAFLIGLMIGLLILKKFLKLEELSFNNISKNFQELIEYSKNNGDSSIDLANSSFFGRMFLVVLRPLFFDAKNVLQYLISIENIITLLVLIKTSIVVLKNEINLKILKNSIFLSSVILSLILFYSIYMYNLGLASRMRSMFMPFLYLLLFDIFSNANKNVIK